jgi:hypothetical protein
MGLVLLFNMFNLLWTAEVYLFASARTGRRRDLGYFSSRPSPRQLVLYIVIMHKGKVGLVYPE